MLALIAAVMAPGPPALISLVDLPSFPAPSSGREYTWAPVDPGFDWDELVVSWNVKRPERSSIRFEARVLRPEGATNWYTMALWSIEGPRSSIQGQKDGDGQVLTDTLRVAKPGGKVELRAYMQTLDGAKSPKLSLVTLSFVSSAFSPPDEPDRSAWGKTIEVYQRSQMSYPNGDILCSPTAVSMLMRHWSDVLRRPELDRDVPAVEAGAIDAGDPKTGNWPFSMAYAASLDAFTAYVSRFSGISDLERWIVQGIPVACSVDYTLLQGKTGPKAGHFVVLIGFTAQGDPMFNDPGWSKQVRQTYKRADFEKAWASSNRTVYLVYPAGKLTPPGPGAWLK
ncbi:MAG: C39 family peptidase [Fimbriimonadales bacterium]